MGMLMTACSDDLIYDDLNAVAVTTGATDDGVVIGVKATVNGEQSVTARSTRSTAAYYNSVTDIESFNLVVLDTTDWADLEDYFLAYTIEPDNDTLIAKFRYFINEIGVTQEEGKFYTDSTYLWRSLSDHCILWAYAPQDAFGSTFMAEFANSVKKYQELATQYTDSVTAANNALNLANAALAAADVEDVDALIDEVDSLLAAYQEADSLYTTTQSDSTAAMNSLISSGASEDYIEEYLLFLTFYVIAMIYEEDSTTYADYTYSDGDDTYTYEVIYSLLYEGEESLSEGYELFLEEAILLGGDSLQWDSVARLSAWATTYQQTVTIAKEAYEEKNETLQAWYAAVAAVEAAEATCEEYERLVELYTNLSEDAWLAYQVEAWEAYYLEQTGAYADTLHTKKSFTVSTDQRDSTLVRDLLLWGNRDYVPEEEMKSDDAGEKYVQVDFRHALAKVTLNLVLKDELLQDTLYTTQTGTSGEAPSWSTTNQIDSVKIDPTMDIEGVVDPLESDYYHTDSDTGEEYLVLLDNPDGGTGKILPWEVSDAYEAPEEGKDGLAVYRCMLIPQTISATATDRRNGWGVQIYIQGQLHDWYFDEDFTFEGGKHYVLTLNVGSDVVTLSNTSVASWEDGTQYSYDTHD